MSQSRLINLNVDALKQFKDEQFLELCKHILGEYIPGRKEGDSKRKKQTEPARLALENLLNLATKEESSKGKDYNKELEKAITEVKRKISDLKSIINKSDVTHGKFSNDKNAKNYKGTWITAVNNFLTTLESNKAAPKQAQIGATIITNTSNISEAKTQEQPKEVTVSSEIINSGNSLENSSSSDNVSPSSPVRHQALNSPKANPVAVGTLPVNNISLKPGASVLPAKQKQPANEANFTVTNSQKISSNNKRNSTIENSLSYHSFANVNLQLQDEANTLIGENGLPIISSAALSSNLPNTNNVNNPLFTQDSRIGFNYEEDEVDSNSENDLDNALAEAGNAVQQDLLKKQKEEQIEREAAQQRAERDEKLRQQRIAEENLRKQQAQQKAEEDLRRKQQEDRQAAERQKIAAANLRKQQEEQLQAQIIAAENLRKQREEDQRKAAENLQLQQQNQNNVAGQPNNNPIPPVTLKPSGTATADNNPLNPTNNSNQQSTATKSVTTPPPTGTVDNNPNPTGTNPTNNNISSQEQLIKQQKGKKRGRSSDDDSSPQKKPKMSKYVKLGLGIASIGFVGGGFFGGIIAATALGDGLAKIILMTLTVGALATPGLQILVGAIAGVAFLAGLAYLAYQLYSHYKSKVPTISNKHANKLNFEEVDINADEDLSNSNSNTKKFNNSSTLIGANNKNGTTNIHQQIAASNGTNPLDNVKSTVIYSNTSDDPIINIASHLKTKQNSTNNSTIKSTVVGNQNENSLNDRDLSSKSNNNRR